MRSLKEHRFTRPAGGRAAREADTYTSERLEVLFDHLWKEGDKAVFKAVLCHDCGLIFTNPRMETSDVERKYRELAAMPSFRARARSSPPLDWSQRSERTKALLSRARSLQGASVLDYGGSGGHNLSAFLDFGPCYLLDYVRLDILEGAQYLGRDLDDIEMGLSFDVILACHVLEHDPDPVGLLRRMAEHLSSRGLIYIEVPLGAFHEWRVLAEPLTHVNFFSERSAQSLAERVGLEVVYVSTDWQWVTRSESWCVNLLAARPSAGYPPARRHPASTGMQMYDPRYLVPPARRKIAGMAGRGLDRKGHR
ncbi:MAG: class I SAM-dependent methyltransferase [Actinomycetota bacterium]